MAHYPGRRTPNVSQYIANLNSVPDMQHPQQEFANFEDDIALFTQGDFFDFDLNATLPNGFAPGQHPHSVPSPNNSAYAPQYYHPAPVSVGYRSAPNSLPSSPPNGLPASGAIQQSQPTLPSMQHFAGLMSPANHASPAMHGQKRRASTAAEDYEDMSRFASEEDKRRRNTAASARFRVKKKQREQALEKTAKEMTDKVSILEARIGQLEMENAWLKGLITEKNVTIDAVDVAAKAKGDKTKKTQKAQADAIVDRDTEAETSLPIKKRGVGTEGEAAKA